MSDSGRQAFQRCSRCGDYESHCECPEPVSEPVRSEPPVTIHNDLCPRCLTSADHSPNEKVCSDRCLTRYQERIAHAVAYCESESKLGEHGFDTVKALLLGEDEHVHPINAGPPNHDQGASLKTVKLTPEIHRQLEKAFDNAALSAIASSFQLSDEEAREEAIRRITHVVVCLAQEAVEEYKRGYDVGYRHGRHPEAKDPSAPRYPMTCPSCGWFEELP